MGLIPQQISKARHPAKSVLKGMTCFTDTASSVIFSRESKGAKNTISLKVIVLLVNKDFGCPMISKCALHGFPIAKFTFSINLKPTQVVSLLT
jgi:hypothetical protein